MVKPDPLLVEKVKACTDHARDLVASAKAVSAANRPNIAYHLAVLALEEIGKRNLTVVEAIAEEHDVPPAWPRKHALDHELKLLWCFVGGTLFRTNMKPEEFSEAKSLSRSVHMKRIAGLYVDSTTDGVSIPSVAVTSDDANSIIDLADTLVQAAEAQTIREDIPEEEIELQRWFLSILEDPERRRIVFSRSSLEKLATLDTVSEWTRWLRAQFDEMEAKGIEAVARELQRSKNLPEKGTRAKWKVRFRIQSPSHSIRPKAFTQWNKQVSILQLSAVSNKKNQFIGEITLPDTVPIEHLYTHAWGIARHFVVSLNIATLGFFWWNFSDDKMCWYSKIEDLDEPGVDVKLEKRDHTVDWGRNTLSAEDMVRVSEVFASLPKLAGTGPLHQAANAYVTGLTYWAASDVHLPLERDVIGHFTGALQSMMEATGEWKMGEPFEPTFRTFFDSRGMEFEEREDLLAIMRAFDTAKATGKPAGGPHPRPELTLVLKTLADWYYLTKILPVAITQLKAKAEQAPSEEDASEGIV